VKCLNRKIKYISLFSIFVLGVTLTSSTVFAISKSNFRAHLSGNNEVPVVETQAQGQAIFKLSNDGQVLYYKLIAANIEDVLQSHIHLAPEGVNGPVIAWLYPSEPPAILISGRFSGVLAMGTITGDDLVGPLEGSSISDLVDQIETGNTYVNVHTLANPAGEIRGQI
jgi:hypothetical protein